MRRDDRRQTAVFSANLGPIVAALFVTIWEIYGTVFRDILPPGRVPIEEIPNDDQKEPK